MLNSTRYGTETDRPPLVIVHGLFGSARNWGVIAKRLSDERLVISIDQRNHGESPWFDSHTYADMAEDLTEFLADFGQVDLLGHSMGGKTCMYLTLQNPEIVRRLVVADIAPIAYSHSQSHLIRAMQSMDLDQISTRSEADNALSEHVSEPQVRAFLLQSLDVREKRWKLNLDTLDAFMDGITGWPEPDGQVDVSALFLAGAESDYVNSEGRAKAISNFPKARFVNIPGAGHWLHAEKPREFEATVRIFLNA